MGLAAAAAALTVGPALALDERVVHNPFTGLAIDGYDPVTFFLGDPQRGSPEHEVVHQGSYWHFVNHGNAAAFIDAPTTYTPAFGGYVVNAVARGVPQAGNPMIYAIVGSRLFLFQSPADRDAFLADPAAMLVEAEKHWPAVVALLAY